MSVCAKSHPGLVLGLFQSLASMLKQAISLFVMKLQILMGLCVLKASFVSIATTALTRLSWSGVSAFNKMLVNYTW